MENEKCVLLAPTTNDLTCDLGTFEGFNFRNQSAIEKILRAHEVVNWDHDGEGEAEFWPSGDNAGVSLIFAHQTAVSASQILLLDRLLEALGGDDSVNFLKIHYAQNSCGSDLEKISAGEIEDFNLHIFFGRSFMDVRSQAAYELFELYYPEAYAIWEKTHCDGLIFDTDRFLDSPSFHVEEIRLDDEVVLLVAPQ